MINKEIYQLLIILFLPCLLSAGPLTPWYYQKSDTYSFTSAKSLNKLSILNLSIYCESGKGLNIGIGPLNKELNEDGTIFVDWQIDEQRSSGEIWYPIRGYSEYPNYTDDPVIFTRLLAKAKKLVKISIYNARNSNSKSTFRFPLEKISDVKKVVQDCHEGDFIR